MSLLATVCIRPDHAGDRPCWLFPGLGDWQYVILDGRHAFPAKTWHYAAQVLRQKADGAWVCLLTENFEDFSVLDYADFDSPALVCFREQVQVNGKWVRCDLDWRQAGTTLADAFDNVPPKVHRALKYRETSDHAYGDLGAVCLPLAALEELTVSMGPNGWNDGANIELARAARNFGLPVKLGKTTIRIRNY